MISNQEQLDLVKNKFHQIITNINFDTNILQFKCDILQLIKTDLTKIIDQENFFKLKDQVIENIDNIISKISKLNADNNDIEHDVYRLLRTRLPTLLQYEYKTYKHSLYFIEEIEDTLKLSNIAVVELDKELQSRGDSYNEDLYTLRTIYYNCTIDAEKARKNNNNLAKIKRINELINRNIGNITMLYINKQKIEYLNKIKRLILENTLDSVYEIRFTLQNMFTVILSYSSEIIKIMNKYFISGHVYNISLNISDKGRLCPANAG